VLGLSFKQNTDDIRDSAGIEVARALIDAGAEVRAYDPQAIEQARALLPEATFCPNAYACAEGAAALAIVTEWDAFRALDLDRLKQALAEPVIVDLRNIYAPGEMRRRGFRYSSVGRP
jgi:UDPglucose 6-dehydrogenase